MSNLEAIGKYYDDIQGMSDRYGANMANYAEGLETTREGLTDNIEALQDLKVELKDYYSNVLSAAAEEINQYTGLMDNNTAVLEHYVNVMNLVGKSTDYKKLGIIL
jgi:hypothetical protein